MNGSADSYSLATLSHPKFTLRLRVRLHHTTDDRRQFSLNAQESLQERSRCLNAPALVRSVRLQVVPVGRVPTQKVVVVVTLHPHLLPQLDRILVAHK